ncbi:MAG: Dabb family protein [Gammaproteobacteria bacterium]
MFHHTVLMEFTANADRAFHDAVEAYAEEIRRLPYVRRYVFRRNLASRSDGLEWIVFGSFESSADHDAYQVSDAHQRMKAYMTPFIARLIACDIDEEQS